MSGFSADWLRLREPFDRMARDAAAEFFGEHDWTALLRQRAQPDRPLSVIDLGCGTGATLRYLAPRLGGAQHWRVCDHDPGLLAAWPSAMAEWAQQHEGHTVTLRGDGLNVQGAGFIAEVERHEIDLANRLDAVPLAEADLVCATALLDLVSHDWLARLIARCRSVGAALSFALTVDGRIAWDPMLTGDAVVAQHFARHQRRDKGFGPALGPQAPREARRLLSNSGYQVREARSDWVLPGGPLQRALIDGMAAAAIEVEPTAVQTIAEWQRQRTALAERSTLRVGHVDLIAWPAGRAPGG